MAIVNSSFLVAVVVFLLMEIGDTQSSTPKRNLLSEGVITAFSPDDTLCCVDTNCSYGLPPICAVDDDLTTVWTLKNGTTKAYIFIQLNASSLVSDISVILGATSVIPSSIVVTASGTNITWTSYFNETCQPNDDYLRRIDSKYYSCHRTGRNLTHFAPSGLFSICNVSGDWLWWETFDQFQLTIEATDADYTNPDTSGSIEIADVQLNGWDEPRTTCNCHPVGLVDAAMVPCTDDKCNCKYYTTTSNSQCIPSTTIFLPTYGPVSGGTIVFITGNYLANATSVAIGDNYNSKIIENNGTLLQIKTSPGNQSDLDSSIPVRIYWERPLTVFSFIIVNWEFTYKPDPVINSISPLTSIISGGIIQTVTGVNLDSVAFPFITLVINSYGLIYYANFTNSHLEPTDKFCNHISSTRLECVAPGTENYALGMETVKLTISVDIDKYNDYENCEIADRNCSFTRTENPEVHPWDDYMVYDVYNGKRPFQVTGNNFQFGATAGDYWLTVGGVQCQIIGIENNIITFNPPDPSNFTTVDDAQQTILYVGYYSFTVGYIQYYLSWIDNPTNRNGLIIGLVCGVGGVIIIILIIVLYRTYYKSKESPIRRQYIHDNIEESRYTRPPQGEPNILEFLKPEQRIKVQAFLLDPSRIELEDKIGSGNFGQVYRGLYFKTDDECESVAIKTIQRSPTVEFRDKVSFVEEATIMIDFKHRNVLSLIGVYIQDGFPYVVLPLMENGDLREFVTKPDKDLTVLDLTSYSLQVAEGMEYLAENKFVHRDLAARNCMINKEFVVKVADFGLARDIFENDYYRTTDANRPLPVKWMPVECLTGEAKFTECSDVWSFGVLMWELFTRGRKPYADVDNLEIKRFLLRGRRLEQPHSTPDFIYELMKSCWKETPAERPRFKKIVTTLKEIISYDAGSSNESAIAPTPSLESIEETANQTRGHMIRPNGPVSYIDLSRNVPTSYIELTLDDSSSNVEHTQDGRGSHSRQKKDDVGSNLMQSKDGQGSKQSVMQDDWGSHPKTMQDDIGSNLEQTQDGRGSNHKLTQNDRGSDPKPTQDGTITYLDTVRPSIPPDYY